MRALLTLVAVLLASMAQAQVEEIYLPNHGGLANIQFSGVHAYQFENLPGPASQRRFRLLVTPPLPPSEPSAYIFEVRIGGTAQGHFEIEVIANTGSMFDLVPGDPELQGEIMSGVIPNETRATMVNIRTLPEYGGRTSEVLFETLPEQ